MTPIEVSINMSHFNAWRRIVNSCMEYGLVVEDDVEVKPSFIDDVNALLEALETKDINFSIFHLWNGNWANTSGYFKKIMTVESNSGTRMQIVQERPPDYYNAGAACYIISSKYAKWLMNHMFPIKVPQDILMGSYPRHGNHLSLRMKYRAKNECYISPILDMDCGGEFGTGAASTQQHDAQMIDEVSCDTCG